MLVRRANTRRVPGSVPSDTHDRLLRDCVAVWGTCAKRYFEEVSKYVQIISFKLCKKLFARFEKSGLFEAVWYPLFYYDLAYNRNIVLECIAHHYKVALKAVEEQIRMECRPFTQNKELLEKTTQILFKRILDYRRSESTRLTNSAGGVIIANEYGTEFNLIANLLAYLRVASIRFADIIPMRVEENFQSKLVESVREQLGLRIFPGDYREEQYRAYVAEDPQLVAVRQDLTKKLEILKLAELEVRKFQLLE